MFVMILTAVAVAGMAARPQSVWSAVVVAGCAALTVASGACSRADVLSAAVAAAPPIVFVSSVMGIALLVESSGLAARLAAGLARSAGGRTRVLFGLVCLLSAALTAALSLDGAVVVMVPIVLALRRVADAPLRPLLLGTVGVSNTFSAALPAGNPTNLVVMERLDLSPGGFLGHMLPAAAAATLACVAAIWALERRALAGSYRDAPGRHFAGPRRDTVVAAAAVVAAGVADVVSPLLGVPPWIPVAGVAAAVLLAARRRPLVALPLKLGLQISSLLVLLGSLAGALHLHGAPATPLGLAAVAGAVSICAALANNLPASAAASTLLGSMSVAPAALLGLSAGALVTPQGSVATLVALDMAGDQAPEGMARVWAVGAVAAVLAGMAVLCL